MTSRALKLTAEPAPVFSCAVIIPKSVLSLATKRNRLRRRIRESLRRSATKNLTRFRCTVIVRSAVLPDGAALDAALLELLKESGILIR